jgi:2-dehydro-3-deoxyphosphogluconate aldolase/(4S)-4-hydroxy-2-oxoglutarate aldolase
MRMDAIRAIAKEVPDAIVGAGTVTNVEQLKAVTEAGAQFAISPGLTESLLKAATEEGTIPLIPGISTVSELMLGMQYGLKEFKFFPAEANGGVKALQAIAVRSRISVSARLAVSLRRTTATTWR